MVASPSVTTPQLTSMSSSVRRYVGVLLASFHRGRGRGTEAGSRVRS